VVSVVKDIAPTVSISCVLAILTAACQLWLKMNYRQARESLNRFKLEREDAALWPDWVVTATVAATIFFVTAASNRQAPETIQVVLLLLSLLAGFSIIPYIVREHGYSNDSAGGLKRWPGLVVPNTLGILLLLSVVGAGMKGVG
jgi:hypothetical protein